MLLKIDELILYLYLSLLKCKPRTTTTKQQQNKPVLTRSRMVWKRFLAGKWLVFRIQRKRWHIAIFFEQYSQLRERPRKITMLTHELLSTLIAEILLHSIMKHRLFPTIPTISESAARNDRIIACFWDHFLLQHQQQSQS